VIDFERRLMFGNVACASTLLWSSRYDDADRAEQHRAWMLRQSDRWPCWASLAELLGPDGIIAEAEEAVAAAIEQLLQAKAQAQEEADLHARLSQVIECYVIEREEQFGITLQRASDVDPFWTAIFREKWERERFRDWFRWQRPRFAEFADYLSNHSALELERRLLSEMLQAERESKKAGLGAGGRRPLRFFRGDDS
jgi:hypothetical protein